MYISNSIKFKNRKFSIKWRKKISKARKEYLQSNPLLGEKSPHWKGGKTNCLGYTFVYNPKHPFVTKKGYVREHRLVMEKHLGRYLKPKEVVHHINGIKIDNHITNLVLFANEKEHQKSCHKCRECIAWNKGKHLSKEHKEKLSKIAKQNNFGKWMKGKKLSEETKRKMSISHKNKHNFIP